MLYLLLTLTMEIPGVSDAFLLFITEDSNTFKACFLVEDLRIFLHSESQDYLAFHSALFFSLYRLMTLCLSIIFSLPVIFLLVTGVLLFFPIFYASINQRRAERAIILSDKLNLKLKTFKSKKGHYITIMGSHHHIITKYK